MSAGILTICNAPKEDGRITMQDEDWRVSYQPTALTDPIRDDERDRLEHITTVAALESLAVSIARFAVDRWDTAGIRTPRGPRFKDWPAWLNTLQRTLRIDLGAEMNSPVVRQVQLIAYEAVRRHWF